MPRNDQVTRQWHLLRHLEAAAHGRCRTPLRERFFGALVAECIARRRGRGSRRAGCSSGDRGHRSGDRDSARAAICLAASRSMAHVGLFGSESGCLPGIHAGDSRDGIEVCVGTEEACQAIIQHGGGMHGIPSRDRVPISFD